MATTADEQPYRTPDRVEIESVAGDNVKVRVWRGWAEYAARVDIERDGRGRWTWGVNTDGEAGLLTTTADVIPATVDDIPVWVRELVMGLDVTGIDVEK